MFGIDSNFYKIGSKVFDLIIMSVITILISATSFGVLFGAAMTSFFYVIDKVIVNDRGYLLKNYFKSFRQNLMQSIGLGLVIAAGLFGLGYVLYMGQGLELPLLVVVGLYLGLFELFIMTLYSFLLLAKFQLSTMDIVRKAVLYGHKHLATTAVGVSLIVVTILLVIQVHPIFIILGFGSSGYIFSRLMMERILPKYVDSELLKQFD